MTNKMKIKTRLLSEKLRQVKLKKAIKKNFKNNVEKIAKKIDAEKI